MQYENRVEGPVVWTLFLFIRCLVDSKHDLQVGMCRNKSSRSSCTSKT